MRHRMSPLLVAVLAWPVGGVALWCLAAWMPQESIWPQAVAALGWSCPPWVALGWPFWTIGCGLVLRRWSPWMAVTLVSLVAIGTPLDSAPAAEGDVLVGVFNINAYSPAPHSDALRARIAETSVEVAVVLEKRPDSEELTGLVRIADDFEARWPRPSHHSAVYVSDPSRVQARITEQVGSASMAMPVAIVHLPSVSACLLGVHAPPQVPKNPTGMAPYIDWLARHISEGRLRHDLSPCRKGQPVVVAGDLNHVPGSWPLGLLLRRGLQDAVGAAGVFAMTWPSGGGWPNLPMMRLDHVLHGPVAVRGLEKVHIPDSDHQGWVFAVGREDGAKGQRAAR